jgi:hypothetical protein
VDENEIFVSKGNNFVWCRVLHSEAYIRYIEGLTKESKSMCNWDRQLSTASEVREYVQPRSSAHRVHILVEMK